MSVPTPLEQIDLLLSAWDERLRRTDENLVALESEAIYQVLAGKAGKRAELAGVTREKVSPALDAVTELFENRERLAGIVAKAREVRESISTLAFWDKDDKIAEIHRLLRGTSVELGQKVVALSERHLLDQSYEDVMVTPEQLLADMARRFEEARTVLLAVSRAWEALDPKMAEIEQEMRSLRALAAELGSGDPTRNLAEAEAALTTLRTRVARDPLAAQHGVEAEIVPRLVALRAHLGAEMAVKERVAGALARAKEERRVLGEEHERALRSLAEARRDLEGEEVRRLPAPLDESLLVGLDGWLSKLEGTVHARRWSPAEVGLTRWQQTADEYHAIDRAVITAAEGLLGRRAELAGRLSARRAQASALAARGLALDPVIEARGREAEALLKRHPLPLDEATRAVEQYEGAVIARSGRRS